MDGAQSQIAVFDTNVLGVEKRRMAKRDVDHVEVMRGVNNKLMCT